MNFQLNKLANNTINQTMIVADTLVGVSRAAAEGTADLIAKTKTPLRNAAKTSIKISEISHKSLAKLVKVQAKAIERSVDAGSARLKLAARAHSLKALVSEQVELLPHTRARVTGDLRDTWSVVTEAGSELSALFAKSKPAAKAKRKVKRKASARKAPAKKAAAGRKSTARKPAARSKVTRKTTRKSRKAA